MTRVLLVFCAAASMWAAQPRTFQAEDHYRLQSAADVQLSPDGTRLAFVQRFIDGKRQNRTHVWVAGVADGKLQRITPDDRDDSSPRWSPDGKALALLSGRRGPSESGFLPTAFGSTIAVAWLDRGTTETVAEYRVTNHPLAYQGSAEQIAWAPDGSAIAFLSAEEGPEGRAG